MATGNVQHEANRNRLIAFVFVPHGIFLQWNIYQQQSECYEMDRKSNKQCDLNHMIDILRDNTQSLCSATLGPPRLARTRDLHQSGHQEVKQRLYFQYEMPPFATNEIKAIQSKNRRAIGHANIALNALKPMLLNFESFPYSVRVYSNITASDGSSSMASVCGGSLCLMDAGVPMRDAVAGISVGLMDDILLTDIAGIEDHFGDMDFKIAGTRNGITSVQLDIKRASGIPMDTVLNAVHQSYGARLRILHSMANTIAQTKTDLKQFAPRVDVLHVPFRDLPRVIGSGGATKQQIQIETGCDINIFWEGECVEITAPNINALNRAKRVITDVIGSQCRVGDIVSAKIINIQSYGVMVQIDDGSEHLVHISQWMDASNANQEYFEGQEVDIMCIGFLGENRPNFSKKAAVWQQSEDPEDRARLRLMLDSLRPPARSRAHPGGTVSASVSSSQRDVTAGDDQQEANGMSVKKREPLSIFSEYPEDELVFEDDIEGEGEGEEDDDILDDEDSTHPIILPPKQPQTKPHSSRHSAAGRQKEKHQDINDSIKNLIDNISFASAKDQTTNSAATASASAPKQSRFANLYKDIHRDPSAEDVNRDNAEEKSSMKWNNLIESITTKEDDKSAQKEKEEGDNNEVGIEHWKSFTQDLMDIDVMKPNGNKIEKDDKGDDLLADLFGEQHKYEAATANDDDNNDKNKVAENENDSVPSRAAALMQTIPQLIDNLDENDDSDNKQEDQWPWQQQKE